MPSDPTPTHPDFSRVPDDPPGTIRRAVRRHATLDHALSPQMMVPPVDDRSTTYPDGRQDRPSLKRQDGKRGTTDRS